MTDLDLTFFYSYGELDFSFVGILYRGYFFAFLDLILFIAHNYLFLLMIFVLDLRKLSKFLFKMI